MPASWLNFALPLAVIAVVMVLRWRRMQRERVLKVERLWVLPAIYAAVVGLVFLEAPPSLAAWGWSALALAVGGGIGWYRGRMMRISVDPAIGTLRQQASPAAFFLLLGLIALRSFARQELGGGYGPGQHAMLATDVAMAFALGLLAFTRIEMALRARRLLTEARATA